jgi:hypothetical protein
MLASPATSLRQNAVKCNAQKVQVAESQHAFHELRDKAAMRRWRGLFSAFESSIDNAVIMAEIASKHQKWDPYSRAIWHVIMNMTGEV